MIRVNRDIRDLLLEKSDAFVVSSTHCIYFNKDYTYSKAETKEAKKIMKKMKDWLKIK